MNIAQGASETKRLVPMKTQTETADLLSGPLSSLPLDRNECSPSNIPSSHLDHVAGADWNSMRRRLRMR